MAQPESFDSRDVSGEWYGYYTQFHERRPIRAVFTLQGDQDLLVPVAQATMLDDKMKSVGASHTLIVFKGQRHGFGGEYRTKELEAMWDFFDKYLKPH